MHPSKPQYSPYPTAPHKYGMASQEPTPQNTDPLTTKKEITHIQQVVGSILYYAIAVYLTVLIAIFNIAGNQAKSPKTKTKMCIKC